MKVWPLYGYRVASERPLQFPATEGTPDLWLKRGTLVSPSGSLHDVPDPIGEARMKVWQYPEPTVDYDGWRFRLGETVVTFDELGEHRSPFDLVVERVVVPLHRLLRTDDAVALHGASVVIGGRGFIFIGRSGAGKSTTARLVANDRGTVASDDLSMVDADLRLLPGAHGVRSHTPIDDLTGRHLFEGSQKLWFDLPGLPPPPAPLRLIVELRRADRWKIKPVTGAAAVVTVLENTFDLERPDPDWRGRRLELAAHLARSVPLIACTYPADRDLPRQGDPLWEHLQSWLVTTSGEDDR